MTEPLPAIAVVQSDPSDAAHIESSLREAGMRNPIWRYIDGDALVEALPDVAPGVLLPVAMVITESNAWPSIAQWRGVAHAHLLPAVVTFNDAEALKAFSAGGAAHAVGTLKPFEPRSFIRLLEPLRCQWLLMD